MFGGFGFPEMFLFNRFLVFSEPSVTFLFGLPEVKAET